MYARCRIYGIVRHPRRRVKYTVEASHKVFGPLKMDPVL